MTCKKEQDHIFFFQLNKKNTTAILSTSSTTIPLEHWDEYKQTQKLGSVWFNSCVIFLLVFTVWDKFQWVLHKTEFWFVNLSLSLEYIQIVSSASPLWFYFLWAVLLNPDHLLALQIVCQAACSQDIEGRIYQQYAWLC